jgi:CRISPR-associated protein Cas2
MDRSFYLIAYDISNNRRRTKIAKILESMGARVQGSVFEVYLSEQELTLLKKKTKQQLDQKLDSLRFYPLCGQCRQKIIVLGNGEINQPPEVIII